MSSLVRISVALSMVVAVLVSQMGCTAARMAARMQVAVQAQDAAAGKEAEQLAPFEFTMGEDYLKKAWEEAGHGEHKTSVELAAKSVEWFEAAIERADSEQLGRDLQDLPTQTSPGRDVPEAGPLTRPPPEGDLF